MNIDENVLDDTQNDQIDNDQTSVELSNDDKAAKLGWKPKEEWDKDPEDWVDSKEYLARGEFFDRIKAQSSTIKTVQKQLGDVTNKYSDLESKYQQLAEHHKKVREVEFERAIKSLKETRKQAYEMGEIDEAFEIAQEIKDLQDEKKKQDELDKKSATKSEDKDVKNEAQVKFNDWLVDNSWYQKDVVLRGAADAIADDLIKKDPKLANEIDELLSQLTEEMEKAFPNKKFNKIESSNVKRASSVTESNSDRYQDRSSGKKKATAKDLNEQQRAIGKSFVHDGIYTNLDEYAQELAAIGQI